MLHDDPTYLKCLVMLKALGEFDPESPNVHRWEPLADEHNDFNCNGVQYVKNGQISFTRTKEDILFDYVTRCIEVTGDS